MHLRQASLFHGTCWPSLRLAILICPVILFFYTLGNTNLSSNTFCALMLGIY